MTADRVKILCSAYDQIGSRSCRYYADHGGKHNFASLDHYSALERELRWELDEMTRARDEARAPEAHWTCQQRIDALEVALAEALDIFDATWCPEWNHAPKPEQLARIAELRKLAQP